MALFGNGSSFCVSPFQRENKGTLEDWNNGYDSFHQVKKTIHGINSTMAVRAPVGSIRIRFQVFFVGV
jgi:hypothetical protein